VHHPLSLRVRRRFPLSASSLALLALSGASALAQNDNAAPSPTTIPQPPAASPAPEPSPSAQTPQQGEAPATTEQPSAPAQQGAGVTVLPAIRAVAPKERVHPRVRPPQVATNLPPTPPTQEQVMTQQNEKFDTARKNIFPPVGANSYEVAHQAIESLPQGNNTTLDKVLLQLPGVTQDSAASGDRRSMAAGFVPASSTSITCRPTPRSIWACRTTSISSRRTSRPHCASTS
jgi:hypothetical protein